MLRRGHCGRVDDNQRAIVAALRQRGWTVQSLATVGGGCPDLLVGCHGVNVLLEVKDGTKRLSAQKATPAETTWQRDWRGQWALVRNADEAVGAVREACQRLLGVAA